MMKASQGKIIKSKHVSVIFIVIAVFTSVLGVNIVNHNGFLIQSESRWLSFLCTGAVIGILSCIVYLLSRLAGCIQTRELLSEFAFVSSTRVVFVSILIINTLFLLAYYPGTQSWDTHTQINDFFDGLSTTIYPEGGNAVITASLNDHHPFMTTLLFSAFVRAGRFFGNERFGVFLYSFLQIVLFSYACAKIIGYYNNAKKPLNTLPVFLFYLLNPFLSYYVIMMLKDSLFSVLFLLYFLCFIKVFKNETDRSDKWLFTVLSIILPLTKKPGIYVVLISNILLYLNIRKKQQNTNRIITLISSVVPAVIMFLILPHFIFPAFNIYPGGKQEVLATLFQQSARAGIEHKQAYTDEEKETLNKVFAYDLIETNYSYDSTDPIKNTFKLETVSNEELRRYYMIWAKTGIEHPITYLKATAGTCAGYFSPTKKMSVYRENHLYDLSERRFSKSLRRAIELIYDYLSKLPGFEILFYMVMYTWWIPLFGTCRMILSRGRRALVVFAPIYVSILILVVCPYSFSRYALPLVMIAPLILIESGYQKPSLLKD